MKGLIAVVDDEPYTVELVTYHLSEEGFEVKGFRSGEEFLVFVEKTLPDLLVLDLTMPGMDGLEVCRVLKSDNRTASLPVIFLTGKGTVIDRVVGLELGADDYVVKPFSAREFLARVKAVLRRVRERPEMQAKSIGDLEIDTDRFEARFRGRKIDLTTTEFRLLAIFAKRPGRVFMRERLLDELWQEEKTVVDRTIDVHIQHLREKLGEGGELIKTVRGVGYKLEC